MKSLSVSFPILTLSAGLFLFSGVQPDFGMDPPGFSMERDFNGKEDPERVITALDLRHWAQGKNLRLVEDCPYRDLEDGEAWTIPPTGLSFTLGTPDRRRHYLYLDLVTFRPVHYPTDLDCVSKENRPVYVREQNFDLPGMHWLEVRIGGKTAGLIHFGSGVFPATPLVFPVDRDLVHRNRVEIELIPSDRNVIFAVWDAFLSIEPDAAGTPLEFNQP